MVFKQTYFDPVERIWRGRDVPSIFHPDASVGKVLEFVMHQHKDKPSQIFEPTGEKWTFQQFHRAAATIAQTLLRYNITQDDVIGICATNTPYVPAVAMAAILIGTPISTLDPSFDKEGILHTLKITQPKILFCDRKIVDKVRSALRDIILHCTIYIVDECNGEGTIEEFLVESNDIDSFRALPLKNGGDHTLAILCSSGSTGLPKGVTMSHKALINCGIYGIQPGDRLLSFSTLYWQSGLLTFYLGLFNGGCRILTNKTFTSDLFIDLIENQKISFTLGPPSQMALLVQNDRASKADLSSMKMYLVGGSAVPFPIIEKLRKLVPNCNISVGYGATEIGGICSLGIPSSPNANGQLKENLRVKVVDVNENKLGVGETGEILVETMFKWNGYYGNKEATSVAVDADGWFKTGDLGFFNKNGDLFIVDRKKEILKYQNFQYFPTEIELVISELPDVVEVCVCGLPDIVFTDLPAAVIIKKSKSSLSENEVAEHVANRMDHFKQLRGGVYFVDHIPKTASGKNVRRKVRDLIMNLVELK